MVNVAILGASGYAGGELVRILSQHPQCKIKHLLAHASAGKAYKEIFPFYGELGETILEDQDDDAYLTDSDMVFLALPHGKSAPHVKKILAAGKKAVDLGADFRFQNSSIYEEWYQPHPYKEICPGTPYGLPEIYRQKIKGADFVANPGCYPTGATLALYPLVKEGLVDVSTIIVDSKSGITGAGRGLKEGSLYCESSESIKAYGVATHRHTPEIEQNLSEAAGKEVVISFTPHLTPMNRGILTTAYGSLTPKASGADLAAVFRRFYGGEYFIRLLPRGQFPQTKWVQGTNFVFLGFTVDPRTNRVIVSTAIDNLVKGAAGQAVQNMNIIWNWPENTALAMLPTFP
ncbi:MAG: N-acetyl-gamma-glutamyl-phosphate reductase [Bacillota bacterium]|nr:N-acetyl-gamma-glutamyl-phosphate reductase [Bacillota bacterium]